MGKLALTLSAALAVCLSASVAVADDSEKVAPQGNSVEVGLFLGTLSLGDDHAFLDPDLGGQLALKSTAFEVGFRVGYFPLAFVGIEAEAFMSPNEVDGGDGATLSGIRGHVVAQLPMRITPFAVLGVGRVGSNADGGSTTDHDALAHFGVGGKYYVTKNIPVRLDVRWLRGPAIETDGGTNHFEVLVGASWAFNFGGGDVEPEPEPDPEPVVEAPKDSDGDGMNDDVDQCPNDAENANGYEDEDGCPDTIPDTDGDGLNDVEDKCVSEPEDMDQHEDDDGCPDTDNDGDGVTDDADRCPNEAGVVENRGCPDTDRDGDGVVDRIDNCPDEAGTAENYGCKKKQLVILTQSQLQILDKVFFQTDKARVRSKSRKLLNNVALVMNNHPDIKKIRVEGHTDDQGKPEYNKDLSQRRAQAVVDYLVKQGVDEDRLEAVGFGQEVPIETNDSKEGRASNRRVEFKITEQ